ncbi:hypothetical protein DPMN_082792 [Dreissena polymorpha]|uniref:Uncharacterized protein n=1 Tax=Dreissena polymorpha TaxID=45954 RepID=A0A9D4BH45_DREPO|nr:hypothetical protein DPMN_082792 [Dreissena polymorpha]
MQRSNVGKKTSQQRWEKTSGKLSFGPFAQPNCSVRMQPKYNVAATFDAHWVRRRMMRRLI